MHKQYLRDDNIYTINALCKLIGCNRKTIVKQLEKGIYKITSQTYNNNTYTAYILTLEDIKKIETSIALNKGVKVTHTETSLNTNIEPYTPEGVSPIVKHQNPVKSDVTEGLLQNVKQLSTENVELKNKIKELESDKVKLELDKSNILVEFTKASEQVKYITDKQSYIEGVNSQLTKDIQKLNKDIKYKNTAIILLSAIILVIVAVVSTIIAIK